VSCHGSTVSLVSAVPAQGYTLDVGSSGPAFVDVEFHEGLDGPEVHASCHNGRAGRAHRQLTDRTAPYPGCRDGPDRGAVHPSGVRTNLTEDSRLRRTGEPG
jgi:hypothetical protein